MDFGEVGEEGAANARTGEQSKGILFWIDGRQPVVVTVKTVSVGTWVGSVFFYYHYS